MKRYERCVTIVLPLLVITLIGCAAVNPMAGSGAPNVKKQDMADLRNGNLLAVHDRYESRRKTLNHTELALLCDLYVKRHSTTKALKCLDELEQKLQRSGRLSDDQKRLLAGRRAMIAFLLGDYKHAVELSQEFELSRKRKSLGGRYVYALSKLGLGEPGPAQKAAALWELSYEPEEVFLAASLYLALAQEYEAVGRCKEATEKYRKVVETLTNEQRRLHRDYTLGGATDIFGNHIASVPLRFDLFGQFAFGLMDAFSYAPQGNVYVSYALAKSELKTGQVHAARKRYDEIRGFKGIRTYRDIQSRALSDEARISRCDDSISDAPN